MEVNDKLKQPSEQRWQGNHKYDNKSNNLLAWYNTAHTHTANKLTITQYQMAHTDEDKAEIFAVHQKGSGILYPRNRSSRRKRSRQIKSGYATRISWHY